jgi:hypothetical protein
MAADLFGNLTELLRVIAALAGLQRLAEEAVAAVAGAVFIVEG